VKSCGGSSNGRYHPKLCFLTVQFMQVGSSGISGQKSALAARSQDYVELLGADHILRPPTKDTTTIGLLKEITRGRLRMVRALCTDVNAAIDASLERHGLLAVRNGDGHRPLGPRSQG
jgi:hypothetical protein